MWTYNTNDLYHHGIKGQKWGIRRYQNQDGSYTSEGKKKYKSKDYDTLTKSVKKANKSRIDYIKDRKIQYVKGGSGNGIVIDNINKRRKYETDNNKVLNLLDDFEKKYGNRPIVEVSGSLESGRMYTKMILDGEERSFETKI